MLVYLDIQTQKLLTPNKEVEWNSSIYLELDDHRFPKFPVQERSERMFKNTLPLSSKQSSQIILIKFLYTSSFGSLRRSGFGPRKTLAPFCSWGRMRSPSLAGILLQPWAGAWGARIQDLWAPAFSRLAAAHIQMESLCCPQQTLPRAPCHLARAFPLPVPSLGYLICCC